MYKRGGTWYGKFRIPGQKPICRRLGKKRSEARAREREILKLIEDGRFFDRRQGEFLTVRGLLDLYVEKYSKQKKKPETVHIEGFFILQLNRRLGDLLLEQLTPLTIENYISDRRNGSKTGRSVSDVTIHHELKLLKHAFKLALKRWDLVDKTPFDKVDLPEGDRKRVRYLKPEEEQKIYPVLKAHTWLFPVVLIAKETGLRRSNLCGLKVSKLDFRERVIEVGRTKNGEPVLQPMTNGVFRELLKLAFSPQRNQAYDEVFQLDGRPLKPQTFSQAFKREMVRCGIHDFRVHDLRHDFCSKLFQQGEQLERVAELAGHKDLSSTRRYAHLDTTAKRKTISKLKPFGFKTASSG